MEKQQEGLQSWDCKLLGGSLPPLYQHMLPTPGLHSLERPVATVHITAMAENAPQREQPAYECCISSYLNTEACSNQGA